MRDGNPRDNRASSERRSNDGYDLTLRWRLRGMTAGTWNTLYFKYPADRSAFIRLIHELDGDTEV